MKHKKVIIGLTGSIGSGKSTVAKFFNDCGAAIFDADEEVRNFLRHSTEVKSFFEKQYPEVMHAGRVSRKRVGALIFSDKKARENIESFLHKKVSLQAKTFIEKTRRKVIVLEIPLLFEAGMDQLCDVTVATIADPQERKARVLGRGRMSEAQYNTISKRQLSDKEKKSRVDVVFDTSVPRAKTKNDVIEFYKDIKNA